MNAARLIELIKYPEAINPDDLWDLKSLTEVYPFFSTGHLLYLKGLKNQNELDRFNEQLKHSAVQIADRAVLYNLIKSNSKLNNTFELEESKAIVIEEDIETINKHQEEITGIVDPIETSNLINVPKKVISLDEIFAEAEDDEDEVPTINITAPIPEANTKADELKHNEITSNEVLTAPPVIITEPIIEEQKIETELLEEETPIGASIHATPVVEQHQNETSPTPSQKMNLGSFNQWLKQKLEEKNASQKVSKTEIIEKFIQTEPRISKPKAAFYSPVEAGKKSLEDDESIVSETLAKIYADSGDYEKAISTYKKLSLLIPEKSAFFAAQIYQLEIKKSLE